MIANHMEAILIVGGDDGTDFACSNCKRRVSMSTGTNRHTATGHPSKQPGCGAKFTAYYQTSDTIPEWLPKWISKGKITATKDHVRAHIDACKKAREAFTDAMIPHDQPDNFIAEDLLR